MRGNALPRLAVVAVATFVALSVAMLVASQYVTARATDLDARERHEHMVAAEIEDARTELARQSVPQTSWDDAVRHLDHRFDAGWATEFISGFFEANAGIENVIIVDRDDRIALATDRLDPMDPARAAAILGAARGSIAEARSAEKARGPIPVPVPTDLRHPPIVRTAVARVGDDILFLSATVVQPDKAAALETARAPIVILAKNFDSTLLSAFMDRMILDDATVDLVPPSPSPDRASVPLVDNGGRVLAALSWTAPQPGMTQFVRMLPVFFAFALLMGFAAFVVIRKGRKLALSLVDSEAHASRLAYEDALTGLPNRTLLNSHFGRCVHDLAEAGQGFAVHCIDLDLFKEVNDSFGHLAGDELIRIVADRLSALKKPGDFLARFGGDEFVFLQMGARQGRATTLARKIIASLAEPVQLADGRVAVGASVGIVIADQPGVSSLEWLRRADVALYRAKELGRSRLVFFDQGMDNVSRSRQLVRTLLHDALVNGEINLAYQPQVDREGRLLGVEALARWSHDELGEVPPNEFVDVAQESGLIDTLGLFTLRQAFEDSKRWPSIRVAINVSAMQLRRRDFVTSVQALLERAEVPADRFELEITEGVLMGDDPATHQVLNELRALGFRIVLDDFGTGYSSLGYLQRFPIDKVKIDRSFIARIGVEKDAEAVVVAIVRLARALKLDVTAEGVETEAQRLTLAVAGCNEVQGYLTGRPMPAEAVADLIAAAAADAAPSIEASDRPHRAA